MDPGARRYAVLGLIRASLPSTTCTVSEIFEAAYGDPQGFDYWDAWFAEPLPIYPFVDLLSVHRAAAEGAPRVSLSSVPVPVLDPYQRQIFEALRVASQSGEAWFRKIGEPDIAVHPPDTALSPAAAQMGEGRHFYLFPREAIAWMYRNPNARHLVPTMLAYSFRDKLAAAGQPNHEKPTNSPQSIRRLKAQAEKGPRSRRGRLPKFDWTAVGAEMARLMNHHGDFSNDDPEWNCQARLEQALLQFCRTTFNKEPALSTLREKIPDWLSRWRQLKLMVGN
jgi:hypothetical protein